ncbi:hypothetical protein CCR75_007474 [Bremia lactucae]|uniref:Uncharacterized protein n=1 Tax=Bremia lactucae TaxID=4779 RepID=A0A976FKV2_BRELC|nr:hypothetical protein CCR75_007474 [Bremia lactucae]
MRQETRNRNPVSETSQGFQEQIGGKVIHSDRICADSPAVKAAPQMTLYYSLKRPGADNNQITRSCLTLLLPIRLNLCHDVGQQRMSTESLAWDTPPCVLSTNTYQAVLLWLHSAIIIRLPNEAKARQREKPLCVSLQPCGTVPCRCATCATCETCGSKLTSSLEHSKIF